MREGPYLRAGPPPQRSLLLPWLFRRIAAGLIALLLQSPAQHAPLGKAPRADADSWELGFLAELM